jgi:hypothetical protein
LVFLVGTNSALGGFSIVRRGMISLALFKCRASSYTSVFGTSEMAARPPAMSP